MKQINYFLFVCIFSIVLLSSCTKTKYGAETTFKPTAASLHVVEPEPIISNERGVFPVIASTNGAPFTSFKVEHLTDFEGFPNEIKIHVPDDVTIDANGNFSRPSKTVVVEYPMVAKGKAGNLLSARFTFTDQDGKTVSTEATKIVVNFKTNPTKRYFYATTPWYNFNTGMSYSKATIGTGTEEVKKHLDIYWVRKAPDNWMVSPNSDLAAASLTGTAGYDRATAPHSRFIKIGDVAIGDVDDNFLENMDFTNSVDEIKLEDKVLYGVLLQDGRKAVVYCTVYSATINQIISTYQVSP